MTTDIQTAPRTDDAAPSSCCPATVPRATQSCCAGPTSETRTRVPAILRRPIWWAVALSGAAVAVFLLAGAGLIEGLTVDRLGSETLRTVRFIGKAFWKILPFFAISVLASAWATVSGFSETVRAVFQRREAIAIAGAAAVGATVPICSCGVIPLIAGLLAGGVPLAPVMAFWISSPLMSPEKFILTAGVLGTDYAVARLVVAVALGAAAGYVTYGLSRRGQLSDQLRGIARPNPFRAAPSASQKAGDPATHRAFLVQAGSVTLFLGKWLAVAFFLEALIVHYVDRAWISALLGGENPFAIPLATAVGIPLYTSGVAAIPIADGLIQSGMIPGAALAFLVAGPVTTIPAMVAVWALVKRRTFAIYLGVSIVGSLAAGYAFQMVMG